MCDFKIKWGRAFIGALIWICVTMLCWSLNETIIQFRDMMQIELHPLEHFYYVSHYMLAVVSIYSLAAIGACIIVSGFATSHNMNELKLLWRKHLIDWKHRMGAK